MSPNVVELIGYVQDVFADASKLDFVVEVDTEDACVVMSSLRVVAVFSTRVVPEGTDAFSESVEELLQMKLGQTSILWQILVRVCERDETVFRVHLCFMHAPDCPFTRFFQSAVGALAARDGNSA